jgi:chlorobactene glucosyltransferase
MFQHDFIYDILAFQLALIFIALSNTWALRRTRRHTPPRCFPTVSILVPARNEEDNVECCVASLLAQDYPDFEVLALDDQSADRTRTILASLAAGDPRLRVLDGQPLPAGWLGKNWACAQLAERAAGELLFFTDADTYHRPQALRALVTALEGEGADLLSGFPRQETLSWGEKFIVPFFSWVTYAFTPLLLGYRLRLPALSTAIGQAMLFRRAAYEAIGGHGAVRAVITEDLELARLIKARGYRWRMMYITDLVSCRMYRSGREASSALSRNLFAAFKFRIVPYVFAWVWLLILFLKPYLDLALYAARRPLGAPLVAVLACVSLALVLWLLVYHQLKAPLWPAVLYPATLSIMELVALRSLWLGVSGRLMWKERALIRPRVKWF